MFSDEYLTGLIDINKYSFNSYTDIFLRKASINCCDNDIEILLKTNEFNFYIKWLEKMMNIKNNNNTHYKKDIKEELIIDTYYIEINNTNHLYYFKFEELVDF